jgi:hypothetical protein
MKLDSRYCFTDDQLAELYHWSKQTVQRKVRWMEETTLDFTIGGGSGGRRITYKPAFDAYLIWRRKYKDVVHPPKFEYSE